MKKFCLFGLAMASISGAVAKENTGPFRYEAACESMAVKNCKQRNKEQEISCLYSSMKGQPSLSDECRSEINRAWKVVKAIHEECEKDWARLCKGKEPFSEQGNLCFRSNRFNSQCSNLVQVHFPEIAK